MEEPKLPKWIIMGQLIGSVLSPGLIFVIPCLWIPQVREIMDINLKVGDGYFNLHTFVCVVIILIALPCFIFSPPKVDLTKYLKK